MASFWHRVYVELEETIVINKGSFRTVNKVTFIDRQPDCFDLNGIIVGNASFEQRCKKMLKDGALEPMKNESSEDGNTATTGSLEESWAKQDEEAFVAF